MDGFEQEYVPNKEGMRTALVENYQELYEELRGMAMAIELGEIENFYASEAKMLDLSGTQLISGAREANVRRGIEARLDRTVRLKLKKQLKTSQMLDFITNEEQELFDSLIKLSEEFISMLRTLTQSEQFDPNFLTQLESLPYNPFEQTKAILPSQ